MKALTRTLILVFAAACASDSPGDQPGDPDASPPPPTPDSAVPGTPDAAIPGSPDAGISRVVSCADEPPPGSVLPPPLPAYTGGTCPAIVPGRNTITSGGAAREFVLVVPSNLDPAEKLPVLVMWHHIGGDADGIIEKGELQQSADELRIIAIVPEKKGDLQLPFGDQDFAWPYLTHQGAARVEEEAVFFDDMLTCVAEHYVINESCISSAGVSAGGLWTSQLLQVRANRLASAIVLSGGVGPALDIAGGFTDVMGFTPGPRPVPSLVLWGGPTDTCLVDFESASINLRDELADNGNFILECVHNCGHAAPPVDPATGLSVLYRFALDHPYWLYAGESPWLTAGVPAGTPEWCGLGPHSSTPRTGECTKTTEDSGCPTTP
jgi:predicted esterase